MSAASTQVDDHASCGSYAWQQVHCDRCGRDFQCTPRDDYYCAAEGDHCCERCLLVVAVALAPVRTTGPEVPR